MLKIMQRRYWFFMISLLVIVPGLVSLLSFGLRPSIDFTGGSLIEVQFQDQTKTLDIDQFQSTVGEVYEVNSVQQVNQPGQYLIRGKTITNQQKDQALSLLQAKVGEFSVLRFETIGPVLGAELLRKTLVAGAVVASFITMYVWKQFKELRFGVSAILAMFHDSLVLLGVFSILGWWKGVEVDVLFVTALLTTLSFSVHDTIVVFDRIREKQRKFSRVPFEEVVSAAVIETLTRSINNSMTIILMLSSLVLLGGSTIQWFAVALLVGAVTGTYSSTFTAAPLLLLWEDIARWRKRSSK